MQFSEIARGRPKRGVFGIFRGQNDVIRLEGLECNKGKLRGLVKWDKMAKSKLEGGKVQFWKDWPMGIRPTGRWSSISANPAMVIARGVVGEQLL